MKKFLITAALILFVASPRVFAEEGGRSVAVLLDISKSISPADFQASKRLVTELVRQSDPADKIGIYIFGDTLRTVTPAELEKVERTASHTVLYDAMYDVARGVADQKAARKALIVMSDGMDTTSATILEDTAGFAVSHHIPIYAVGTSRQPSRSLERIAKLTGGRYFGIATKGIAGQISTAIASQKPVETVARPAQQVTAASQQPGPAAAAPPAAAKPATQQPGPEEVEADASQDSSWTYWFLGALLVVVVLAAAIYAIRKFTRRRARVCPACGRELEDYQTICPGCTSAVPKRDDHPADSTQEIAAAMESEVVDEVAIPEELLEKKPIGEEVLTKTFVLTEAPVLVVRKGKNLGQAFILNKAYPVSIGRSRVNEIRLEDSTVSGQHCRIIPENGKHVLYDLGSTNGTFLNEKKVKKAMLNEGDIVKVGETQFLFKVEQQRNT